MVSDPFFEEAKVWSKRKHRILGKYLVPFNAKVGSWAHRIFIVDGFAGCAKYDDGTEGSPLLTAKLTDECLTWKKPVNLHIINVEKDPDNFVSLTRATSDWASRGTVTNRHGTFQENLKDILSEIGHHPAFFFVDPYGPSNVLFADLGPILQRSAVTELILNFDLDGLSRIGDTIRMHVTSEKERKTRESNVALVDQIMGNANWQRMFLEEAPNRADYLLHEYMQQVSNRGFKVVAYPVRESFQSKPKYYLVYCTRHEHGISLMNDFLREEEDQLIKEIDTESDVPALSEDFHLEPMIADRRNELRKIVLSFAPSGSFTRGEIKDRFTSERFGDFHSKDYNAVIKDLITGGKIVAEGGRKRINDETPLNLA